MSRISDMIQKYDKGLCIGLVLHYSCLSDATGSCCEARRAGIKPNAIPTVAETPKEITTDQGETIVGMDVSSMISLERTIPKMIPINPPVMEIMVASARN